MVSNVNSTKQISLFCCLCRHKKAIGAHHYGAPLFVYNKKKTKHIGPIFFRFIVLGCGANYLRLFREKSVFFSGSNGQGFVFPPRLQSLCTDRTDLTAFINKSIVPPIPQSSP